MSDIVKQEGGGQVFIPESLNDTDKEYLQEVSGQITTTIQRAAVRVGYYLLEVKERFRENGEFSGTKGWFINWYTSLGMSRTTMEACTNAALLTQRHPHLSEGVELLSTTVLANITQPNVVGGTSTRLQQQLLKDALDGSPPSVKDVRHLKALTDNKVEAITEALELLTERQPKLKEAFDGYQGERTNSNPEYQSLKNRVSDNAYSIAAAEANIEKLLNAPDPVVEEPKEEPTPTPPTPKEDPLLKAKEEEIKRLQAQLEATSKAQQEEAAKKDELLANAEKVLKKVAQHHHASKELPFETLLFKAETQYETVLLDLEEARDPKTVTPTNVNHRLGVVQNCALTWAEYAITYERSKINPSGGEMQVVRTEKAVRHAWQMWIEHLALDTVQDLKAIIDKRLNESTAEPISSITTIDATVTY